jgi:hypothetical protein
MKRLAGHAVMWAIVDSDAHVWPGLTYLKKESEMKLNIMRASFKECVEFGSDKFDKDTAQQMVDRLKSAKVVRVRVREMK